MEKSLFSAKGRIRRKTYWLRWLIILPIEIVANALSEATKYNLNNQTVLALSIISLILSIPTSIFIIIQGVKRMHDVDKSGWYLLIPIYDLILMCTDGTIGKNQYGDDPKSRDQTIEDPAATWNCPQCNSVNSNTTFVCVSCNYSLK
jgi:uncharacterized membrane protein YhaH (DUF805 family)